MNYPRGNIPGLLRRCSPVMVPLWKAPATVAEIRTGEIDDAGGKHADRYRVCGSVNSWEYGRDLVLDLDVSTGMDHGARFVAEQLLDVSWGTIEGAVCHMSWRGYMEIHVWTTKTGGRPLQIDVGSRFSTSPRRTFEEFEERSRTHGRPETSIHVPVEHPKREDALALAIEHLASPTP